ncbi:hypothetical protein ACFQU7_02560 [Pseudoroseomonas wenyumeiae]
MALRFVKSAALAAAMTLGLAAGAVAAEGEIHIPDTKYSFDGPSGPMTGVSCSVASRSTRMSAPPAIP